MATPPDEKALANAPAQRSEPAYLKVPGLGALALNAGAVTALTAVWKELPGGYAAKYFFNFSFSFFALGVIFAVCSLSFHFVRDSQDVRRHALHRLGRDRAEDQQEKEALHFVAATRWMLNTATASLGCFLLGVAASMLTLIFFKFANPEGAPIGSGSATHGGDTIVYNPAGADDNHRSGGQGNFSTGWDTTSANTLDTDLTVNFNFNVAPALDAPHCPLPTQPTVCPPPEPSKLCRCSERH
jgi:hypothetical protein